MRILITAALILGICTGCCTSLSVIEPAHKLAIENQKNLSNNVKIVLDQLVQIARSHPDFDPVVDEPKLADACRVLLEQVAISTAYVALLDGVLKDTLEVDDFVLLLDKVPAIIASGKNLWEEIDKLTKKEK